MTGKSPPARTVIYLMDKYGRTFRVTITGSPASDQLNPVPSARGAWLSIRDWQCKKCSAHLP